MSVAAVVLAAGASRRLGRPKQMVVVAGETLVQRAVRIAHEAELAPVIVVVPSGASFAVNLSERGCLVVPNRHADEGIASSIRAGVRQAEADPEIEGIVIMTCDQVGTTPGHLRALFADRDRVTGSGYASRTAVPAYFPRRSFEELLKLTGDTGARSLLSEADVIEAPGLEVDVDTEEDVLRAQALFGRQA